MLKTTVLIKLDVRDPDISRLTEMARASREGKLVAFPTETVYGVGGPMSIRDMAQTLSHIKRRDGDKPFTYHIGDWSMIDYLGVERTPEFRFLARKFWPGPLTLIVKNKEGMKIGLRFPRNRLATALFNAAGEPFIATSANLSGAPSPRSAEDVMSQLKGQIDFIIDGGPSELGEDSTVVDVTGEIPVILRRGAEAANIEKAIEQIKTGKFPRKRVLFVCTGNSCRSPMAEGWLLQELKRKGLAGQIEVASTGIMARRGNPATPEAVLIMKNREIDISNHRSRPCAREDIATSDLIIAMSNEHLTFITGMYPTAKERIKVIDIPDPIGLGLLVYEEVVTALERKLRAIWNDIVA